VSGAWEDELPEPVSDDAVEEGVDAPLEDEPPVPLLLHPAAARLIRTAHAAIRPTLDVCTGILQSV